MWIKYYSVLKITVIASVRLSGQCDILVHLAYCDSYMSRMSDLFYTLFTHTNILSNVELYNVFHLHNKLRLKMSVYAIYRCFNLSDNLSTLYQSMNAVKQSFISVFLYLKLKLKLNVLRDFRKSLALPHYRYIYMLH